MQLLPTPFRDPGVAASIASVGLLSLPLSAQAYIGPGAGLTAVGTGLALLAALLLAIAGFIWYPVKRLLRKRKQQTAAREPTQPKGANAARND